MANPNISAQIGILTEVIKAINENKQSIIDAASSLKEIITTIAAFADSINKSKANVIKRAVGVTTDIIESIKNLMNVISRSGNLNIGQIQSSLDNINVALESLDKLKLRKLILLSVKLDILSEIVPSLVDIVGALSGVKTIANTNLISFVKLIDDFISVISSLDKLKLRKLILLSVKLDILSEIVPSLVDIINELSDIKTQPNQKINQLQIVFEALHNVISILTDIKTKGLRRKIRSIQLIANDLEKVIKIIGNINVPRSSEKTLKAAAGMIKGFRDVIITLLILTPLATLFVVASPLIVLVVWLAGLVIRLITFIIMKSIGVKTFIAITLLIGMLGMLIMLSLEILILALLAPKMLKGFPALIKVLIGIVVIAAILALFGWIVSMAMPLMLAGLIGVGIITLAVFAILAIAAMLWLIGEIQLDVDKIMSNVTIIFDVANQVIMAALAPIDNPMEPIKDRELTDILTSIGLKNLGLIMASIQLALTVVAVFCILLIAAMLRLLQMLNLDTARILNNVAMIFDVCQMIIERVFQPDSIDVQISHKLGLEPLTMSLPASFRRIIGSIFALAYLAVMVIAVACVLLIASMLRLLQNLNLDEATILNNVKAVIDCTTAIINSIFLPDSVNKDPSERTALKDFLLWAGTGLSITKIVQSIFALAYLAVMVIAVAAIWGMVGMLSRIENLQLDKTKILNNVKAVIDCTTAIINSIFLPDSVNKDPSERTALKDFLLWAGTGLSITKIVQSIFALAYLAVMVIAVLCLVGIAKLLGVLQNLKLDKAKILKNVQDIMSIVHMLMKEVFQVDGLSSEPSKRTALEDFLTFAFSGVIGIFKIVQAVFALAYLAVMFIAVAVFVGIAKLLQHLGNIDPSIFTKAQENIKTIIGIIDDIKNICFRPDPKTDGVEQHGALMFLVKWVLGAPIASMLEGILTIGYIALMYFTVVLIMGLAKLMEKMADVDDKKINQAADKAWKIFNAAREIQSWLLYGDFKQSQAEGDNAIISALKWVWGQITDFVNGIGSMVKLFPQMGIMYLVVGLVYKLGDMIGKISEFNVSEADVKNKTQAIVNAANSVLGKINEISTDINIAQIKRVYSVLKELDKNVLPTMLSIAKQFNTLSDYRWGIFKSSEDRGNAIINNMKSFLNSFSEDLQKTGQKQNPNRLSQRLTLMRQTLTPMIVEMSTMTDELTKLADIMNALADTDIEKIKECSKISTESFNVVKQIIFKILGNADINSALTQLPIYRNAILEATRVILQGKNMINAVGSLVNQINSTSEIGFDTLMNSSKFYQRALNEFNDILTNADKIRVDDLRVRSTMDLLDRISQTVHNFVKVEEKDVKNSKNITDNYIKFLQQVDKMDYQKLNTTAWIMRSWASISRDLRGDFEGLSRTVNQHIMPMLNALNKTMDETTKCQKQIIDELTKPVTFGDTSGIQSYSDTPGSGTDITSGSGSTDSGLSVSTTTTQTQQPNTQTPSNRPHASQPKIDTDIKPGKYVVDLTKITPYN